MKASLCLATFLLIGAIQPEECDPPLSDKVRHFGMIAGMGSISILARVGWGISCLVPGTSNFGKECLLLSHLSLSAAERLFRASESALVDGVPRSQHSWYLNHAALSQIGAQSDEDKKLLSFLDNHYLAKATGFFTSVVDRIYPCFGVSIQVHPESVSHYARNPWNKISTIYQKRVDYWKQSLPHPAHFPLILTRPYDIKKYLPFYFDVSPSETMEQAVERLSTRMQASHSKVIVDLTSIPASWHEEFSKKCDEHHLNLKKIICIQREQQEEIGGLRLLPLPTSSKHKIARDHRFLLKWISTFGLSANRIELDRCTLPLTPVKDLTSSFEHHTKEELLPRLSQNSPQLMVNGTLKVLEGLFAHISEETWNKVASCPTKSSILDLSISRIKEQLQLLEKNKNSFYTTASHLEEIHAHLSTLLEIFSPFTTHDFPEIYKTRLNCIPPKLKPLTSCSIHSSGMTTVAGIFKAAGAYPRVLYGENTYFECIKIAELVGKSSPITEATDEDFKEVDLILAQFNPALKRIELKPTEYRVEQVAEVLRRSLNLREGKPLTLALDCTIDFIDSPRVRALLTEFQNEIESGILNVICYRSGLKFDLFGMDNYCGAPFYMIHNKDSKWSSFDHLITDPVLQTDRLSLNWFCLAYQSSADILDQYRKQIFDNTRALLTKVPPRLFNPDSNYRIIPADQNADMAFIDIKISGPFHKQKGAALVGGSLNLKCLQAGHPIFHRPSIGFYHPNFTMLFNKENTTIRLTLGLDPSQVDVLTECFKTIDALNETLEEPRLEFSRFQMLSLADKD